MSGPWEKYQPATVENSTGKEGPWAKYAPAEEPIQAAINKSPTAGVLDAGLALGSGAIATPVSGLAALPTLISGRPLAAANLADRVRNALTYEPKTPIGQGITNAVSYPFQKLAEVADAAGKKTTEKVGPYTGSFVDAGIQLAPALVGRVRPLRVAETDTAGLKLKNVTQDAATTSAKEAGFAVPPSQANPSIWNKIVEGFAGKIKTGQDLSLKNQPVGNDLVRKGLGLAEDAPLTPETLASVRKQAGQAYERVRSAGAVTADPLYRESLDKIAAPFERAAKDFPDAARTDVLDAVKAARRDSFDASSAVDQISILRDKADTAFAARDKKLGGAYKGIANALEEQLGRHLEGMASQGSGVVDASAANALNEFRNARETIAKTYSVEKHLQPSGNVDLRGLAADLKKGRPLSGELKTAAEFATNFPKAAQLPEKIGGVPSSPIDAAWSHGSVATGVMSGHPALAAGAILPYTRPLLRKLIASKGYQDTFANPPSYGPTMLQRLQQFQGQPIVPMLEAAEGQRQ